MAGWPRGPWISRTRRVRSIYISLIIMHRSHALHPNIDRPRSRNRKQPRGAGASGSLMDTSAADDADMFDEDGGEPVYCLCRQVSFGEMIACDNAGKCPYEWFHYECVGLAEPPRGLWYCPVCAPKMKRKMLKKEQRMAE